MMGDVHDTDEQGNTICSGHGEESVGFKEAIRFV
jgi:hypothetical protein